MIPYGDPSHKKEYNSERRRKPNLLPYANEFRNLDKKEYNSERRRKPEPTEPDVNQLNTGE